MIMTHENEILSSRLKREAQQWIELEMEKRMAAAEEEIKYPADVGSNIYMDEITSKHVKDATDYARQEIRRELEMDAERWIEEELKKRGENIEKTQLKYRDESLDARFCGMDDH